MSPRLAGYLAKKGYSFLPYEATNYVTNIVNQVLARRRQRLETRNDFIQIMIDHEQEVTEHEQSTEETEKSEPQQWRGLKKSTNDLFYSFCLLIHLLMNFSFE